MHRAWLVVIAITLLCFLPPSLAAETVGTAIRAAPFRLSDTPGVIQHPTLAIDTRGIVHVAWAQIDEASTLHIHHVREPGSQHIVHAQVDLTEGDALGDIALSSVSSLGVAWATVTTDTLTLYQSLAGDAPTTLAEFRGTAITRCYTTFGPHDRVHLAWVDDDTLHHGSSDGERTLVRPTTGMSSAEIDLVVDRSGNAHIAWSVPGTGDETPGGVFVSSLFTDTTPIQIAAQGDTPRMASDWEGNLHLVWQKTEGLAYVASSEWSSHQMITAGKTITGAYAIGVGPNGLAHVAWADRETLWYAQADEWAPRVVAHLSGLVADIRLAVDETNTPHIVWHDGENVFYQPMADTPPQLVIRAPMGGTIEHDTTIVAEDNGATKSPFAQVAFYLQEEDTSLAAAHDVLSALATDFDPHDGWTSPLRITNLSAYRRYRVLAQGTDFQGSLVTCTGPWFSVRPQSMPWILTQPNHSLATSFALEVIAPKTLPRMQEIELYLQKTAQVENGALIDGQASLTTSPYAGRQALAAPIEGLALDSYRLAASSTRFPAGIYRPLVATTGSIGQRLYGLSDRIIHIDSAMGPIIEIEAPRERQIVRDTLAIRVDAHDPNGTVAAIDFLAERCDPQEIASSSDNVWPDPSRSLWLGSDTSGADGWGLRIAVDETLDGDCWRVRAIAHDDQGLTSSALSPSFSILAQERPMLRILLPTEGSHLRDMEPIHLLISGESQKLDRATVYALDDQGTTYHVGVATKEQERLVCEWDTRTAPDGSYSIVVIANHTDGRHSLTARQHLHVKNDRATFRYETPRANAVLSGMERLWVLDESGESELAAISVYLRAPSGRVIKVCEAATSGQAFRATWDTRSALDGSYELVTEITDATGRLSRIAQPITINNATPILSNVSWGETSPTWRQAQQILWEASHPHQAPMTATLAYSPDDGTTWLACDPRQSADGVYEWSTIEYPDSERARLRLALSDGNRHTQVTSPPARLDNVNQAPHLAALAPEPHSIHGDDIIIAWHAHEPDGQDVTISIDARLEGTDRWIELAHDLANTGRHTWHAAPWSSAGRYALRLTARDPLGATTEAIIEGIGIEANRAPDVRLIWPNKGVQVRNETAILWKATDADDDRIVVDLYYSPNAGRTWLPLANDLPNTGYYVWQVSFLPTGTLYRVRVVARDGGSETRDESDGVFSIGGNARPQLSILSPQPGDVLSGDHIIRWHAMDPERRPISMTLSVRMDGSGRYMSLIENVPDDGVYVWHTRSFENGLYDLRLTVNDGRSTLTRSLSKPVEVSNRANHAPTVRLVSPRGGEVWDGVREILWSAHDRDGDPITATIASSADGGLHWESLATVDAGNTRWLWDTRESRDARDYMIRVVVSDGQASMTDTSEGHVHVTTRYGHPPSLSLKSPDPNGRLLHDNTVTWWAEDPDQDVLSLSLAVSDDDGFTWRDIATGLINDGAYLLPTASLTPGRPCRLRLRADDGVYQTQVTSPIIELASAEYAPVIQFLAPDGKKVLSQNVAIEWAATDPTGQQIAIRVESSADGGQTWQLIQEAAGNTGRYIWNTRTCANGTHWLRLTATSTHAASAVIGGPLTVQNTGRNAPMLSIIDPSGGAILGGTHQIKWLASDADYDTLSVTLAYSLDWGNTWRPIAYRVENTGNYVWDTTGVPNSDAIWLKATVSDGSFERTALCDQAFAIGNSVAPSISLLTPSGGDEVVGSRSISWRATTPTNRKVTVKVDISTDMAQSWDTLAEDLPAQGRIMWDTTSLRAGQRILVRALASDVIASSVTMTWPPLVVSGTNAERYAPVQFP